MSLSRRLPVIFIVSLLGLVSSISADIRNVRFTSATYNGYISENVVLPIARKHNTSILVRFVDMQKPSVTLETERCHSVTISQLTKASNLRITGAVDLFQLDTERFDCMQIREPHLCLCQFQIRLKDDSVRYKLNREAKSLYPLEMKLNQNYAIQTSTVSVHILDDNDLEPMFDPSEYVFELNEFDQLPAFTRIGQVFARDPDLGRNALLRYYLAQNSESTPNVLGELFGVNWYTGELFIKQSLARIFDSLFNGHNNTSNELSFELEVKSLDSGLRTNVAKNLLRQRTPLFSSSMARIRNVLNFDMSEDEDTDIDPILESSKSDAKQADPINYKLIHYAASLYEPLASQQQRVVPDVTYYGTSIEAAYVTIKLVRSFKSRQNYQVKFTRLADMVPSVQLLEQIKFKLEKNFNSAIPFGLIELVHFKNLKLAVEAINGFPAIPFKIDQVYLNNPVTDTFLVFIQANYTEIESLGKLLAATRSKANFTVHAYDRTGQVFIPNLVQFEFALHKDLVAMVTNSCRVELDQSAFELELDNPAANTVLLSLKTSLRSSYGVDDMCQLFLSSNLWYQRALFHAQFSSTHNQSYLSIDRFTGTVRLDKVFYGKLRFQFRSGLFFNGRKPLDAGQLINIQVESIDRRPSLNASTPIHAVLTIEEDLVPIVNYFKKSTKASRNVFDSLRLMFTAEDQQELNLPKILSALNWHYSEFNSYELVYCFDPNSLTKLDMCSFELIANGSGRLSKTGFISDTTNMLVRLTNELTMQQPLVRYISLAIVNASNHVEFEHQNCSVLVRQQTNNHNAHVQSQRKSKKFNFEQSQIERVLLVRMDVKQNETVGSKFKFSLIEEKTKPSMFPNQLDNCFEIDQDLGDVYYTCTWPFAHHSLFKEHSQVARVHKRLRVKVRKYPKNIEATTYLDVQFEITRNSSQYDTQPADFNVLLYQCAQEYADTDDSRNVKSNYLITKLLTSDFKRILHKLKSRTIVTANTVARNFSQYSFDIVYKPKNSAIIPAGTQLYRLDLVYILRNLNIDDTNDEAMFYEFRQLSGDLFRLNILTGLITLVSDWQPSVEQGLNNQNVLTFSLVKSLQLPSTAQSQDSNFEKLVFTVRITFDIKGITSSFLPRPVLSTQIAKLHLNAEQSPRRDQLLLTRVESYLLNSNLSVDAVYKREYKLEPMNVPFYIEVTTGDLYYNSLLAVEPVDKYKFDYVVQFFYENERVHELTVKVTVINRVVTQLTTSKAIKPNKKLASGMIDLSMPITSTDFISNMQSKLIGFFPTSPEHSEAVFTLLVSAQKPRAPAKPSTPAPIPRYTKNNYRFRPRKKSRLKVRRKPLKFSIKSNKRELETEDAELINKLVNGFRDMPSVQFNDTEYERKLLWSSFYSMLYLDKSTGALYFNAPTEPEADQQLLYSKLSQLIDFYHFDQNMDSKRLKVDALLTDKSGSNNTRSIYIDLVFKREDNSHAIEPISTVNTAASNQFKISSDNLLDLFTDGDEFVTTVKVSENSPANRTLLNIREYFEGKVNRKSSRSLMHLSMLKSLRFYLLDEGWSRNSSSNRLFTIEDNVNGLLRLREPVQFDYEQGRSYLAKVLVVQSTSFDGGMFNYWLDVKVLVENVGDEGFACDQPVYMVETSENQINNKKLLTIGLVEYEVNQKTVVEAEKKFKAEIVGGDVDGLFDMNGLTLFTGATRRRLNKELMDHYELTVRVLDLSVNRMASCLVLVNVTDLNDNRPIVNDIELVIYDKLDTRLVDEMKIPIANAIAIDPDSISKLIYKIVYVRYFYGPARRLRQGRAIRTSNKLTKSQIAEFFTMNATNGNLYAQKTPCSECTIIVQYRVTDIGSNRNRMSRRSTIKLHVKKLPVSLFKTVGDDMPHADIFGNSGTTELAVNPAIKTFDLRLYNITRFIRSYTYNRITLQVDESTKLGEKLFQINIEQKIALNQLAIIYFNLLDDVDAANRLFYVANNDGSLYLIKPLDAEGTPQYNLTVLITNWLGQVDYVFITINVNDVNDNRPRFINNQVMLNHVVDFSQSSQTINLIGAYDMDQLDGSQLTFSIQSCLPAPQNMLLKKQNSLVCSLFSLLKRPVNQTHQLVSANLNIPGLRNYLNESSDLFLSNKTAVLTLILDMEVKDSAQTWSDLARVTLNLYLNSSGLARTIRASMRTVKPEQDAGSVEVGFREPVYYIKISSMDELVANTELIRLSTEFFQYYADENRLEPMQPFDYEFYAANSSYAVDFVNIEKSSGLVYFNQTINTELLSHNIIQLDVGYRVLRNQPNQSRNKVLHNSSKLIIFIASSVLTDEDFNEDLIYHPIWSQTQMNAYVNENSPVKSWLFTETGQPFTVRDFISTETIRALSHNIQNLEERLIVQLATSDTSPATMFQVEPSTGYIQTLQEFDFEVLDAVNVTITACIRATTLCFRQSAQLTAHVQNWNDNEPKVIANKPALNLFHVSELMRAMSLFTMSHSDADNDSLVIELARVDIENKHNCSAAKYVNPVGWFAIFTDGAESTVFLTDLGYDTLIHFSSKVNYFNLAKCQFIARLVVKASDDLFGNQVTLSLNVDFKDKSGLMHENIPVPVLSSLELTENVMANESEPLLGIHNVLASYLSQQMHNKTDLGFLISQKVSKFELKNYVELFYLNDNSQLCLRTGQDYGFDRESRDTYELFIGFKNAHIFESLVPSKFRVLVKLTDINDNKPQFYEPLEASLSTLSLNDKPGYNRTITWSKLTQSSKHQPLWTVKASDLDIGANGFVEFELSGSKPAMLELANLMLELDRQSGQLYVNQALQRNASLLEFFWKTYATMSQLRLEFIIVARDAGVPQLSQSLKVNLDVLFVQSSHLVHFNQSFYYFRIPESIESKQPFAYVNSIVKNNGLKLDTENERIVYSIASGDLYNQFSINYNTGALKVSTPLDYKLVPTYLLTISAYNTAKPDHIANATVRIDLDNVYDSELQFSQYEYNLEIRENIPKMSRLIQLNVLNSTAYISYQLLNHMDKFYINHRTGSIYNKVTFDYESPIQMNRLQLKIKAKTNKKTPLVKKHLSDRPLQAECVLNIKITNVNDNPPQFEKLAYISRIQINRDRDIHQTGSDSIKSILPILLDPTTHKTESNSLKFVSKINAKDVDSTQLSYLIVSQAHDNLFMINNETGIIYLDQSKYRLLKEFGELKHHTEFELQLLVSDSMLTNQARMTVSIEELDHHTNSRPVFKIPIVNLIIDYNRFRGRTRGDFIRLFNLERNLVKPAPREIDFAFNYERDDLAFFQIKSNKLLVFDIKTFKENVKFVLADLLSYQIPVTVCSRAEAGLCDQILIRINVTSIHKDKAISAGTEVKASFAYSYGVLTIQQKIAQTPEESVNYDDYYLDDSYTANERFYTELRINKAPGDLTKYEYELVGCQYNGLNVTYAANTSIGQEVDEFKRSADTNGRLTLQQLKSLFLLNKHNGVLSSRRTINEMLPGVYQFTVRLRHEHYYTSVILDTMKYKLTVLPSSQSVTKPLHSYFKFSQEVYKFKPRQSDSTRSFGQISVVQKVQAQLVAMKQKTASYTNITYTLIASPANPISKFVKLDTVSGQLGVVEGMSIAEIAIEARKMAQDQFKVTMYALGSVHVELNRLEYMCEIQLDFSALVNSEPTSVKFEQAIDTIQFGTASHLLKINENLAVNSEVYRFIAIHQSYLGVEYRLDKSTNSDYFTLDARTGLLETSKTLDKESLDGAVKLRVVACYREQCAETEVHIELIDVNDNWPAFELPIYQGLIREDSLPGTVVLTVQAHDADLTTSDSVAVSRLEYFIINGDAANQFAVSADGKVYTRLMLDTERVSAYTLDIMAFDGQFKAITKLIVDVQNVNDNRPECANSMVHLTLSESALVGDKFYTVSAHDPDLIASQLKYRVVPMGYDFKLPFAVDAASGELQLVEPLDFESKRFYAFYVQAFKSTDLDGVKSMPWSDFCMFQFNIEISDVNDNRPVFPHSQLYTSILENSPRGSLLLNTSQLIAIDADSGSNRVVRYSLHSTGAKYFNINQNSGLISLAIAKLNRESIGNQIDLTVRATDLGGLYSDCNVTVGIIDINDNHPVFEQSTLFLTLQENLPRGFVVTKLNAIDLDDNSTTEYFLVNSTSAKFHVESITGSVVLDEPLDFEERSHYVLYAGAFDTKLGRDAIDNRSIIKLIIDVLDLNDNPPQFNTTPDVFYVKENVPVNTTITEFNAFDLDSTDSNKLVEFSLSGTSQLFDIDTRTGRLFTVAEIDYEQLKERSVFNLTVQCRNERASGNNKLMSSKQVRIVVEDLNDNEPVFERLNQTIIFRESFQLGKEITRFLATDADANTQLTFVIIDQFRSSDNGSKIYQPDPIFNINQNGSLFLMRGVQSDEVYIVQVRVYDHGKPTPLFSDTYLTVRVADELSNEPKMTNKAIEIVTLGSIFESQNLVKIEAGQVIGQLTATDADAKDTLFYQLQDRDAKLFSVNKLTGVLKSNIVLAETSRYHLNPLVTDKKFITESDLNIRVNNVNSACLQNSIYVTFNAWYSDGDKQVSLSDFVGHDYLTRFKQIVSRIINSNRIKYKIGVAASQYDVNNIQVISMRNGKAADQFMTFGSYPSKQESTVEILFSVESTMGKTGCVNSKLISKLLNRRKSVFMKRMRLTNRALDFKLVDINYNNECFGKGKSSSICSINQAFENCHLQFQHGYNQPSLCQLNAQTRLFTCFMFPEHSWSCGTNDKKPELTAGDIDDQETYSIISEDQSKNEEYIGSCRRPHNPCQNNAICKQVRAASLLKGDSNFKVRIHCFCPNGFKGQFCEEDINECDATTDNKKQVPCVLGAQCINTHGSYVCNCTSEPASKCYNTLSPQYSASKSEQYKFYGKSAGEDIFIPDSGTNTGATKETDEILFGVIRSSTVRQGLLGLVGAVCGILVILTLAAGFICQMNFTKRRELRRRYMLDELSTDANTQASNSVGDCISQTDSNTNNMVSSCHNYSTCDDIDAISSLSTPTVRSKKKPEPSAYKSSLLMSRLSKNRSSMTAALLDNPTTGNQGNNNTNNSKALKTKGSKFSINNLLFTRLNQQKNQQKQHVHIPLSVCSSSSQEISSSGSSSPAIRKIQEPERTYSTLIESTSLLAKEKLVLNHQPELYGLKESENDADDEDLYQSSSSTLKPIKLLAELKNDMSSFSRERPYKKKNSDGTLVRKHFGSTGKSSESQLSLKNPVFKFNTLQIKTVNNDHSNPFGYNTISNGSRAVNKSSRVQLNTSTFMTGTPKKSEPAEETAANTNINKDDSLNTIEDNCQESSNNSKLPMLE